MGELKNKERGAYIYKVQNREIYEVAERTSKQEYKDKLEWMQKELETKMFWKIQTSRIFQPLPSRCIGCHKRHQF